jgi:PQQ-dependent catabolism-associated CXXCW motif protein
MSRNLFLIAVGLAVTACVYQPQGYWRPYSQAYYPQAYPAAYPMSWSSQPAPGTPYTSLPVASSVSPAAGYNPTPPPTVPESPLASDSSPEPIPASASNDTPSEPVNPRATFADETVDYGVAPTNTLHLHDFDAPTPTHIERAHTVTTRELQAMLNSPQPPVLIDVIGGQQSVSLPHAVWLRDAGVGRHLDDDVQAWFDLHLSQLTGRDKSHPVVFFCASRMCWLAHNATLRAIDLGYTNVYWYRGGRDSWQAAGLPMSPVDPPPVNN